eukprot:jgi/Mesvir1/9607/Mv01674-RA.1
MTTPFADSRDTDVSELYRRMCFALADIPLITQREFDFRVETKAKAIVSGVKAIVEEEQDSLCAEYLERVAPMKTRRSEIYPDTGNKEAKLVAAKEEMFARVDEMAAKEVPRMEKGGPTSQVVGDSPPRGEASEGQAVQAQGASSQQPPHKRAREGTPPPMVESGVSFAAVTGKDEYHGGLEMVDDPVKRIQIERFERLANGTREQQFALYQDILNDKPEVAKVPYTSKRTFMPRFETLLQQELRLRRLAQNAPETVAAAPSHAAPAAVAQKRGESVHESAAVPSTARDPPATSKPVATGDMPPPRQGEGGRGSMEGKTSMFSNDAGNLEGGGPIFEAGRQGGANLQGEGAIAVGEPVSEGVGGSDGDTAKMTRFKEQADAYKLRTLAKRVVAEYVQAERATHAAILYSISLDQHARSSDVEVASTWTAAVDEFQKGLSEALATHKGKALKGKGKGKEVEVADAPVSLLEKWEKSPVSQDDDDILDVNDEIAKGKRLRKQLAVQPRDLDDMSKALVHRNRVWTRNLFVGPQKLLARDLHLSRAEQNATIFANSESDYGHDKLVIPVWRYSFQFLADRCPNSFHEWTKKEGTQRQLAQLFGEMGGHGQ